MLLQNIKRLIYQADLFCSSQLLRYNSDTQYNTLTGGLLSLSIISVIIIGFASMIASTLNRSTITSTTTTVKQSNPPLATLIAGEENMFMFSISIQSLDLTFIANLSAPLQYFDIEMNILKLIDGWPNYESVGLQQCSSKHWNMMPEFDSHFDAFQGSSWLCLPLGYQLPISGSYTSAISYEIQIQIYPCRNKTAMGTCASQDQIKQLFSQYGNFYLGLTYINPVINPNSLNFMDYYVQGNDYVIFSDTIGAQAWVYFSDYTIVTDNSIWPYSEYLNQNGCIVESKAINHPYTVCGDLPYVSVYLAKSENSLVYNRQVQKISAVFSYIGGLVGAVTALLFLVKSYTDSSLEVTIGLNLFQSHEEMHDQAGNQRQMFDFFGYISLTFYRILRVFGYNGKWQLSQKLEKFQDEALKQLDVQILLKRLIKLQTCMTHLLTPEQLNKIKDKEKITIESAYRMRQLLLKSQEKEEDRVEKESEIDNMQNDLMVSRLSVASNVESGMSLNRQDQISDKMVMKPPIQLMHKNSEEELKKANELLQEKMKSKIRKPYRLPLPINRKIVPILPSSES